MATYTIQAPDGNTYSVDGPDGASQADVQSEVLKQNPNAGRDPSQMSNGHRSYDAVDGKLVPTGSPEAKAAQQPTSGMSTGAEVAAGAGKAVYDAGRGVGQLIGTYTQKDEDEQRKQDKALMSTRAGQAGELLGNVAMMLGTPGGFVGAAATGAAQGALTPTGTGESRAANIGAGAALGAAGQVAGKLMGKVVGGVLQPFRTAATEVEQGAARTLTDAGVPLNAAQQGGGKLAQTMSNIVQDNPFVGSTLSQDQRVAFTKAVMGSVGVDSETADPVIMARIKAKVGGIFDSQAAKTTIPMDKGLVTGLNTVETAAQSALMPDEFSLIKNATNQIMIKAGEGGGTINGAAFQSARTMLSNLQARKDQIGHWAGEMHDVLTDALQRNAAPEDAPLIAKARTQWKALKQIEPAINEQDQVVPNLLYNSLDRQKYTNQMIYGAGDQTLVQLATAGKLLLNRTTPNSGTTQRMMGMVAMGSTLSAVDDLANGRDISAGKAALYGLIGPAAVKLAVENPRSARLIGQWARSKAVADFRNNVVAVGSKAMGKAGAAAVPSMGGTGVQAAPDNAEDLEGTEQ